jgi:hypothetical protein
MLSVAGREPCVIILEAFPPYTTLSVVCDAEREYILLARELGFKLTNSNDGGEGSYKPSAETLAKRSAKLRGNQYARGNKGFTKAHTLQSCLKMTAAWTPDRRAAQAKLNRERPKRTLAEKLVIAENRTAALRAKMLGYPRPRRQPNKGARP